MEDCSADLLLHVVQFLNIKDSGCLALSSKRVYYLVHHYRKLRGPEIVTVASYDHKTKKNIGPLPMTEQAIDQMQSEPDFALTFQTDQSALSPVTITRRLPKKTIVLGVDTDDIQVNLPGNVIEHNSHSSSMYVSFPNSIVEPFVIHSSHEIEGFKTRLLQAKNKKDNNKNVEWKAIIVHACGRGGREVAETFLTDIQASLPDVVFVGGVCREGYISRQKYTKEDLTKLSIRELLRLNEQLGGNPMVGVEKSELVDHIVCIQHLSPNNDPINVDDGVFGIALGGDVPIRSMVSRGVKSVAAHSYGDGIPQPSSPYIIHESKLIKPNDGNYPFMGGDLKPIHEIRKIRNVEDSTITNAATFISSNRANFFGIKKPSCDGFELNMFSPYYTEESYFVMTDGSLQQQETLEGAEIDLFDLDGDSCLLDMEATVSKLKEQTMGETILGAVMFSCSGRGPGRGYLIRENMADASRFASKFPDVPCLGYYAGGEIGPLALAGKQNVFQTGQATLQGFTAVFALFVVPAIKPQRHNLDDCDQHVNDFFTEKWSL